MRFVVLLEDPGVDDLAKLSREDAPRSECVVNFDGVSLAACSDPYLLTVRLRFWDSVVRSLDAAAAASSKFAVAVLTLWRLRSRSCRSSVTSLDIFDVPATNGMCSSDLAFFYNLFTSHRIW